MTPSPLENYDIAGVVGMRVFKAPSYWTNPEEWWCDVWTTKNARTFHAHTRTAAIEAGRHQATEWLRDGLNHLAVLT